jgi:hypothetical protein
MKTYQPQEAVSSDPCRPIILQRCLLIQKRSPLL